MIDWLIYSGADLGKESMLIPGMSQPRSASWYMSKLKDGLEINCLIINYILVLNFIQVSSMCVFISPVCILWLVSCTHICSSRSFGQDLAHIHGPDSISNVYTVSYITLALSIRIHITLLRTREWERVRERGVFLNSSAQNLKQR